MRFSKLFVVSAFWNWLYSSEQKPRKAGNFLIFENVDISPSIAKRLYVHMPVNDFKTFNSNQTPPKN